jgi:hypothetical protein
MSHQIRLTEAARELGMDTTALRRVLNRFSIEDRDSRGRRVIAVRYSISFLE